MESYIRFVQRSLTSLCLDPAPDDHARGYLRVLLSGHCLRNRLCPLTEKHESRGYVDISLPERPQ